MDREPVLGLRARRAKGSEQLLKLASLSGFELGEQSLVAPDQVAHRLDLRIVWYRLLARPVPQLRHRGVQSLPSVQQLLQVRVKVGQIRRVGAKVNAAQALVTERTRRTERFHVVRLDAMSERHRDPSHAARDALRVRVTAAANPRAVTVD